jgi:hypothetical protein
MDPVTTSIITGWASGVLANFSTDAVKQFFTAVFREKPELEEKLKKASSITDVEVIFQEAVGVIDACAERGAINIDGGLLDALRGIRFDHANGTVNISGTTMKAHVLVTGGGVGASGTTVIGENTEMRSKGTSIRLGKGCSIRMTGGSNIKQT